MPSQTLVPHQSAGETLKAPLKSTLSSVYDEILIDLDIFSSGKPLHPDHDLFVVIDTTDNSGICQPGCVAPCGLSCYVYKSLDAAVAEISSNKTSR